MSAWNWEEKGGVEPPHSKAGSARMQRKYRFARMRRNLVFWRWTAVVGLLGVAAWSANLTLGLWWAGGAPPTPYASYYHRWGNVYFAATSVLVLLAILLMVRNIRAARRAIRKKKDPNG